MLLRCFPVCKTNQLYSLILSLLLWCSEISKTLQHSYAHVAKSLAQTFSDWFRHSLCVYLVTLTHSDFIRLPVKLMPKENRLLLHIEYWAFHCTDSFSMDWITVKFIGCGVTGFSANTPVFLSNLVKFWLFKNPYYSTCVLSCPGHVLGTQRLNFWCCFSRKMTAYLKRLFCNLQYKNVCILVGFGPILSF